METDADRWAFSEFGQAALGNKLRTKRLVRLAAGAMDRPAGRVTDVFREPAQREAAFRFVESDEVDEVALKGAAHDAGAKRCADATFAYVAVDKSSLTLPGRPGTTDFGMVASADMAVHGVLVMSALAVTPDGTPQGIVAQEYWTRPVKKKASRVERRRVPSSESETQYWLKAMDATAAHFEAHAPNCRPWFQIDREPCPHRPSSHQPSSKRFSYYGSPSSSPSSSPSRRWSCGSRSSEATPHRPADHQAR